jgi:hypothetical protein
MGTRGNAVVSGADRFTEERAAGTGPVTAAEEETGEG